MASAAAALFVACTQDAVEHPAPGQGLERPAEAVFRVGDPRWKQAWTASSGDGLAWTPGEAVLARAASSPNLVEVEGQLRVYFVHDGRSIAWLPYEGGEVQHLRIDGIDGGMSVDPCVLPLDGGGYRLYFVHHPELMDPGMGAHNRVLSARSDDGERWSLEPGVRIEGSFVDPDVVVLPDGEHRMYLTRNTREVLSALSRDGLDFELEPGSRFEAGGVTSTLHDGESWRMYFHESGALGMARSADPASFDEPRRIELPEPENGPWQIESPSVLRTQGRYLMVYVLAPTREEQAR
jgi:hypothetical protein